MKKKIDSNVRISRVRRIRKYAVMLLAAMVLFFLILSTMDRKDFSAIHSLAAEAVAPFQHASTDIIDFCSDIKKDYSELIGVRDENRRLLTELREFRQKELEWRETKIACIRLERLLELKRALPFKNLAARVIGRDSSHWHLTLLVDRGHMDGVKTGMAAIVPEGVVGQIISTYPHYSKVLLATSPSSAIEVVIQPNRVHGILKGRGERAAYQLEYILKTIAVKNGDTILTASSDNSYPAGIQVGRVVRVLDSPRGMFHEIDVASSVDFSVLEHMLLVLDPNKAEGEPAGP